MGSAELNENIENIKPEINRFIDGRRIIGFVPGTGWREGAGEAFEDTGERLDYATLNIPGADNEIEGHGKKELSLLKDETGRFIMKLPRIHGYENPNNPDAFKALHMLIGASRESMDGILVTTGVGALYEKIKTGRGKIIDQLVNGATDIACFIKRGGKSEARPMVGDIVLVDDMDTASVGLATPVTEFIDWYHNGLHREDGRFLQIAESAIAVPGIQDRCPKVTYGFRFGPQFEGRQDKLNLRWDGCDVVGMSLLEVLVATQQNIPVIALSLVTNGAFKAHGHEDNQAVGVQYAPKAAAVLKNLVKNLPNR